MTDKKQRVKVVKVTLERHIPLEEKTCPQCGKTFWGMKRKRFCTKACARKASYWRNPKAYRESRLRSYRRQKEQEEKA